MQNSKYACYPSLNSQKICRLSGVEQKLMRSRIISLKECEKLLVQVIRETKSAATSHDIWQAFELGARATVMVCDILVVGLEAATGPGGTAISKLYDGSKMITNTMASGKIDSSVALSMLVKNKAAITQLVAKEVGAKKFNKVMDLTLQLISYGEAMWGFFSGVTNQSNLGGSGIRSSIASTTQQHDRIRNKIQEIEKSLAACEIESGNPLADLLA